MKIGIHPNLDGKLDSFTQKYADILQKNRISYELLSIQDKDFWQRINNMDAFIIRSMTFDALRPIAKNLLPVLDMRQDLRLLPNAQTYWHYDDKISQAYMFEGTPYPFVKSWVFWDKMAAIEWSKSSKTEYPLVFKLKSGAGSRNVQLIHNVSEAQHIIRKMFARGMQSAPTYFGDFRKKTGQLSSISQIFTKLKRLPTALLQQQTNKARMGREFGYVYFQRFLPNNSFDTRVTVIGKRAFAFRRLNRAGDFRASGSGTIDYEAKLIDLRCVEIALAISQEMRFQTMAYDFLFDSEGAPHFCEISYTYLDIAVYRTEGYWDENLNFHQGHWWPQYFHLIDLLERHDLTSL